MSTPIFISYKRNEAVAADVMGPLEAALRDAAFVPWRDDQIAGGQAWRARLDEWLLDCRGAVVVVSPEALTAPWVRHEISVLMTRHHREARFPVVPLLVGGVQASRLSEGDLSATRIGDLQAAAVEVGGDPTAALQQVIAHFQAVAREETPFATWVRRRVRDLSDVLNDAAARDLLAALGAPCAVGQDPCDALVRHVARDVAGTMRKVVPHLRDVAGGDRPSIAAFFRALLPHAWIAAEAAARAAPLVGGLGTQRAVVLDGTDPDGTPAAVRRRTLLVTDEHADRLRFDLHVESDDPAAELHARLRRELKQKYCGDRAAPDEELDAVLDVGGAIAVDGLLDQPDAALIDALARLSEPVVWYLLCGDAPTPDPVADYRVTPPVNRSGETLARALTKRHFPVG